MDCKGFSSDYTETIELALEALGKDNFFIILPMLSFPSLDDMDTGVGTGYSSYGKDFLLFLREIGINGIQFMPSGIISRDDPSPYRSSLFSDNFLFIDLFSLTEPEYACILDRDIFYDIVGGNPNIGQDRIAYSYVYDKYLWALGEAYRGFCEGLSLFRSSSYNGFSSVMGGILVSLEEEFNIFVRDRWLWIYADALFYVLSLEYGSEDWGSWDYIDRVLCLSLGGILGLGGGRVNKSYIVRRREELDEEFSYEIGFYSFVQFLCYRQRAGFKVFADGFGFSLISDSQVSLSSRDIWANQDILLDGYCLGVPPDYFSDTGQAWGFPVLDPVELFGVDGGLARGGIFLKDKFRKIFRESSGVRIDHFIGLVDPWVYRCNDRGDARLGGGRLFSSPDIEGLSSYSYISESSLNPVMLDDLASEVRVFSLSSLELGRYCRIVRDILFSVAFEEGVSGDFVYIYEDLGTLTYPVRRVMEEYGLGGVRVTEFVNPLDVDDIHRGVNVSEADLVVAGTHDNDSLISWCSGMSDYERGLHVSMLVDDLFSCVLGGFRDSLLCDAFRDTRVFVDLKLAELFASRARNVEIMFTDFFGISCRYNMPATVGSDNWTLRLRTCDLLGGDSIFWRLPYILFLAFRSRGRGFEELHKGLLRRLESFF